MKRNLLIDGIYELFFDLAIIKEPVNEKQTKYNIGIILEEPIFIESLYNAIFIKAKKLKVLQNTKITDVLIELEKIRLTLEK